LLRILPEVLPIVELSIGRIGTHGSNRTGAIGRILSEFATRCETRAVEPAAII
jgi:hypothetical protein